MENNRDEEEIEEMYAGYGDEKSARVATSNYINLKTPVNNGKPGKGCDYCLIGCSLISFGMLAGFIYSAYTVYEQIKH